LPNASQAKPTAINCNASEPSDGVLRLRENASAGVRSIRGA
jgi:hypothetical protein